jgi:stage II sporulation protein M
MKNFIFNFYNDNRAWFKTALNWFLVAAVAGGLTFFVKPDFIQQIVNIFQSKFGPEPARNITLAKEIFTQNSIATLIALVGGVFFGISSFFIILFNGFIIGFVITALFFIPGNYFHNLLYIILGLAPHGIFEIPAFILASALGLRLGLEWTRSESAGKRLEVFKQNCFRALQSIPSLLILLAIAAVLEVFVSGHFADKF